MPKTSHAYTQDTLAAKAPTLACTVWPQKSADVACYRVRGEMLKAKSARNGESNRGEEVFEAKLN